MTAYRQPDRQSCQAEMALVFARAPVAGRIKTRLAPEVGGDRITNLYKCFVSDTLNMLLGAGHPVRLCYDPPEAGPVMRAWLGDHISYQPQKGGDLGEKMADAFASAFSSGIKRAILIGTDAPDLPAALIDQAFESLAEREVVIGPAIDGGYYLIGFRRDTFQPRIFQNIPWSTSAVYASTLKLLTESRASVYSLPLWRDIDNYNDLCALADSLARRETSAPATAAFIAETGMCSQRGNGKNA